MNSEIENMTEHDLLAAILEAKKSDNSEGDDALTMSEIVERLSISDKKARSIIKEMLSSGLVEVLYVQRETITTPLTGRLYPKPGYRLKNGGAS